MFITNCASGLWACPVEFALQPEIQPLNLNRGRQGDCCCSLSPYLSLSLSHSLSLSLSLSLMFSPPLQVVCFSFLCNGGPRGGAEFSQSNTEGKVKRGRGERSRMRRPERKTSATSSTLPLPQHFIFPTTDFTSETAQAPTSKGSQEGAGV